MRQSAKKPRKQPDPPFPMYAETPYAGPERRLAKPSPLIVSLAALGLAAMAFVTLCPIGLRPHLASANQERFGAYLLLGGLIAMAAGRRVLVATGLVVAAAVLLEGAQALAPGRHAALADASVKALGGVIGAALVQVRFPLKRLFARAANRAPEAAEVR